MKEYIKREAVMKVPEEYYPSVDERLHIVKDITSIPAADVAPVRHGRWTDVGSLSCRCSECGCKNNRETAYCPACGAHINKEDEHEAG